MTKPDAFPAPPRVAASAAGAPAGSARYRGETVVPGSARYRGETVVPGSARYRGETVVPGSARYRGETVVPGSGSGGLLVLEEALSFWGGYDAQGGTIVEQRHPQFGTALKGRFLLMARAKGSSSSSSVLAEAIRNGTGPAAIVMQDRDLIVALGCIVASELYGIDIPIAVVDTHTWQALAALPAGAPLRLDAGDARCEITGTPFP
ncbi:aconitase X swivel domain-containing protein [Bordetella genomosp. 11]|uniref:aconitase X swivel domain-containing protein n=1 Tax=Bordetella genomosp. 11 TaxID=1416808 RepID=UPI0020CE86A8|nr:DUF126 domain-containing protein [Bordetella genomosp. 11]